MLMKSFKFQILTRVQWALIILSGWSFGSVSVWAQGTLEQSVLSGEAFNEDLADETTGDQDSVSTTSNPEGGVDSESFADVDRAVLGPKSVPLDHVLVVQRRYISKEGRWDWTPMMLGLQSADSFGRQFQWSFSVAYNIAENFAIEALHFAAISNFPTGLAEKILGASGVAVDRQERAYSLGASLIWTPLKAKAALDAQIHHFEGYFLGGGGITQLAAESVPLVMIGTGFRLWMNRSAFMKIELRDYLDVVGSQWQQRPNLGFGLGLLWGEL